ncbi:MAG TPA: hypothetical protein VG012_00045 [Acidimicrobiia bacterium]|jgi:hypothetical protein|nr:hypothetical protein [Acidimicrobiia bacterium]
MGADGRELAMSDDPEDGERHGPPVDVSGSLGTAGHETEDLGWQDRPDDAPVTRRLEDVQQAEHEEDLEDLALENVQAPMPPLPADQG